MADQFLQLATDALNTGKKLDLEELAVGSNTVERERHQLAGRGAAEITDVKNADPLRSLYGAVVRPIKSQSTPYRNINLGIAGQMVKASPGSLRSIWAMNLNTGGLLRFLKVYDKATASASTDTPIMTIPLMPGVPTPLNFDECAFALGCSVRACTGVADNDNSAPAGNEIVVIIETI